MAWASLKPGAAVFLAVVVARMLAVLPNFDACRVAARCIRLEALKIPVENRTPPPEDSQTRLPLAGNATDRAGFPGTVVPALFPAIFLVCDQEQGILQGIFGCSAKNLRFLPEICKFRF